MSNIPSNTELEKGLEQIFPEPDTAFVGRLERQLVQQAAARLQEVPRRSRPVFHPLAWAAAALAVVVFVVLAAVGPQNALAAVQKLIGYVPGIGFIEDPQQPMLVLAGPVQVAREGVTVSVEKALANDQFTQVRIRVDGLPQNKALFEPGWGESHQAELRAAAQGGDTLTASAALSGAGDFVWAEYTFPPLPAGVGQATLLLDRLPGLVAGAAPENWAIDIPLREVQAGDGIVTATEEARASQPASGARLVLESIASTAEQTALKLRLESDNPLRQADSEWWRGLVLVDDQGQELPLTREQSFGSPRDGSQVLLAPRLDPGRSYTLRLEQSLFEYSFDSLQKAPGLRLRPPAGLQTGQTWAVDESLEAGGYRLHISQASLQAGEREGLVLRLSIDPQPGLIGVGIKCKDIDVCSSSGFEHAQPGGSMTSEVYLDQLPDKFIDLQAHLLVETARGPWEVHFQVDGGQ